MTPIDSMVSTFNTYGLLPFVLILLLWVFGFILSAFVMSLWIRLILTFMGKRLDAEYARMRGPVVPTYVPLGTGQIGTRAD